MAEEPTATAATAATETAAPATDAGAQQVTESTQQAEARARAADGKFAAKAEAVEEVPEWRRVLGKRAKDFTGKTQLAKSYVEAEQRLSRSIVMPGKDATDEERVKFDAGLRRAIGVPEKIEDFKVAIPEGWGDGEAALVSEVIGLAHAERGSPALVEKLLGWYAEREAQAKTHAEKAAADFQAESIAAKQREWGPDYKENLAFANAGMRQFGEGTDFEPTMGLTWKEAAQQFGDAKIGDHPDFLEVFARVGREIGDPTVKLQVTPGSGSVESIEQRMSGLYDELYKPGTSESRKADINAELNGLNEKLYGTRPITGRAA